MKRLLIFLLLVSCLAGCSQGFVYQRKPDPTQDATKLPFKVAIVAFQDGTGDFTSKGNLSGGYVYNLAKTGIDGWPLDTGVRFYVSPQPPALWAKSLTEEMIASSAFRSVKFMFNLSEVTDEDIVVEGVLTKAYFTTIKDKPDEFGFHLKVRRMSDRTVVWEGDAGRSGIRPRDLISGCVFKWCFQERIDGYLNGVMQRIFADARLNIVQAFVAPPSKKPDTPGQESPEELIKRILGKP